MENSKENMLFYIRVKGLREKQYGVRVLSNEKTTAEARHQLTTPQYDSTHDSCTADFDIHWPSQGMDPRQCCRNKRTLCGPD